MSHTFGSFKQYHFRGQHPNEVIVSVIHRHWFSVFMHYMIVVGVVFVQIIAIALLPVLIANSGGQFSVELFWLMQMIVLTFLTIYGAFIWIDYWLDVWIVTNQRIINIEQNGLFARNISELHFQTVQDITSKVHGLIPTFLNYGDVEVQTAAVQGRFLFRNIPDPYKVRAMLIEKQKEYRHADL